MCLWHCCFNRLWYLLILILLSPIVLFCTGSLVFTNNKDDISSSPTTVEIVSKPQLPSANYLSDDFNIMMNMEETTSSVSPRKHFALVNEVKCLQREKQTMNDKIRKLKRKLKAPDKQNLNFKRKVRKIFNSDQILSLERRTNRGSKWSAETIQLKIRDEFSFHPDQLDIGF